MIRYLSVPLVCSLFTATCICQEAPPSISKVAASVRDSIVVVTTEDRDGGEYGMGTGFVIDDGGLIATSLHVIGESRPIWVQDHDGKRHRVIEVHASDRNFDLAILRIEAGDWLKAIPLGNDRLENGDRAIAIGHPLGLKHSVVSGIVAGERDWNGTGMWQVAMTIEPGNSGGPLLDLTGRVEGVVTLKSLGVKSFGFAVKVGLLRKLIERPNPTSIENWANIDRLDASQWKAKMGSRWTQRGGRIHVESPGEGFGGRSLLLRANDPPELPFEVAVSVKLDDEAGAAGLVFHSDGGDRHYGFYPSGGSLRMTNFDGPSVFTWEVVRDLESKHYLPGKWNEIKVRVEKDRIMAYVNNQLVTTLDEVRQPNGKIGLCKFRETKAEFKDFRFGKEVDSKVASPAELASLSDRLSRLPRREEMTDNNLKSLGDQQTGSVDVLEQQAQELDLRAAELRKIRDDLHVNTVCQQLRAITEKPDADIDLLEASLWIARLDNPSLNVDAYVEVVNQMAKQVEATFPKDAAASKRIELLNDFLFRKAGYHGSRIEYYEIGNSQMDQVLDNREGIPITLSVLYLSLAKRVGLDVVGVGLPGHFVVRHEPKDGESQLIDPFEGGKFLSRNEANIIAIRSSGQAPTDAVYKAARHIDILRRILTNMRLIADGRRDAPSAWRYVEALAAISPGDASYRGMRAVMRLQLGRKAAAAEDFDWLLDSNPAGIAPRQLDEIRAIRDQLRQ